MVKSVFSRSIRLACLSLLALVAIPAWAQFGDNKANAALDKAIMQLFGKGAFSAQTEVAITGAQNISMDVEFAVLDGQTRSAIDLGAIRSDMIPAAVLGQMKSAGLDKMVSVTRNDSAAILMIYPNAKSYVDFTPPGATAPNKSEAKVAFSDLGKETLLGQECTKQKVTITDEKGATSEILAWMNAKKLPVQLQTSLEGTTVTMSFKKLNETKPDAALFKAPAGYTKYDSVQALMMQRMMDAMKPAK